MEEKTLDDFLNLPDVDDIQEEIFVNNRLGKFKVKAMTSDEFSAYQKRAKTKVGKDGIQFDGAKFNLAIVAGQVIYPDFNNAELLKKAKCTTGTELIKRKLLPGEIGLIADKICTISGFDSDFNEDVEEAKN